MKKNKNTKNPFEFLSRFYKKTVKQCDEQGYAEIFAEGTRCFFKVLEKYASEEDPVLTFTPFDIEYLDGYFIFGHGTNSVIHFKVRECPGWLFGIWWSAPSDDKKSKKHKGPHNESINGEFFTQYQENIDKFKPSYSEILSKFSLTPNEKEIMNTCGVAWEVWHQIRFIMQEPELAFCRDYKMWDYNYEYHTREEAIAVFQEYEQWKINKNKYTEENNNRIIDFVKQNIVGKYKNAHVGVSGFSSPSFQVFVPLSDNTDLFDTAGFYNWLDEDDPDYERITKEYSELVQECDAISDKYNFFWSAPFGRDVLVYE